MIEITPDIQVIAVKIKNLHAGVGRECGIPVDIVRVGNEILQKRTGFSRIQPKGEKEHQHNSISAVGMQ